MKRSALVFLAVLAVAFGATAQEEIWDLAESHEHEAAEFSFMYPAGFEGREGGGGIFFAESAADLDAALDADDETSTQGVLLYVIGGPFDDWGVDKAMTIVEMSNAAIELLNIQSLLRTPVSMMGKAATVSFGTLANDREAAVMIWADDGNLLVFGLETPDHESMDVYDAEFGRMSRTFQSTPTVPLDAVVELDTPGVVINVPSVWTLEEGSSGFALFEVNPDESPPSSGAGMFVVNIPMSAAGLADELGIAELTLDDVQRLIVNDYFRIEDPVLTEMNLYGIPALSVSGQSTELNVWVDSVIVIFGDHIETFTSAAPSPEMLESYEPTFHAMLQSVGPAPEEPGE